ncbi:HAD family hydrolase [Paenibacillus physcomitrellae]|uniref:MTA/SAH nucleosidase n=1 Tax=Paenibacillus physcomitrellae TaxID=1619311 RepID=A0ABQ1GKM4_9BACL|nr:HAD hydrolase-like protein [Paenibacillus physcomitrellae]GGA45106.1 MTA/SAH nucleosidase [Paenibacillus physcomitrellae]
MLQTIIFDMDGTLFQTDKILEASLEETFDWLRSDGRWAGETPLAQYRRIMGVPLPKVWETLLPGQTEELRSRVDVYFLQSLVRSIEAGKGALYPYVEEMLAGLKKAGCSLFIASNGLVPYLQAIVSHYRLDRWITETFSIEQIQSLNKSDLVKEILLKYGVAEGAVVGDRLSDIRAAKENGLTAIGCRFDFAQDEELAQADLVIHDFVELKALVELLRQGAGSWVGQAE